MTDTIEQPNEHNVPARVAAAATSHLPSIAQSWTPEEKELISSIFPHDKLTKTDFEMFCLFSRALALNPLAKEIYPVPYQGQMSLVTSIHALRRMRDETGKFRGFISKSLRVKSAGGEKVTILHEEYDPDEHVKIISATVKGRVEGYDEIQSATAVFNSFNKGQALWKSMPDHMIIKCAEAQFYRETGLTNNKPGVPPLYSEDEAIDVEFSAVPQGQLQHQPRSRSRRKTQTPVAPQQEEAAAEEPKNPPTAEPPTEAATEEAAPPSEEQAPEASAPETPKQETKSEAAPAQAQVFPDDRIVAVLQSVYEHLVESYKIAPEGWTAAKKCLCDEFGLEVAEGKQPAPEYIPGDHVEELKIFCRGPLIRQLATAKHIEREF